MKNWSYTIKEGEHAGKTLWSGRYCAVVAFIFCNIKGEWHILANRRGEGTPDFQGLWNCPCGYLEAAENGEQCAARETWEETGVHINPSKFNLVGVETDPRTSNNGNVTIRYAAILDYLRDDISVSKAVTLSEGEENEVEAISWISLNNIHAYKWAFNHEDLIPKVFNRIFAEKL